MQKTPEEIKKGLECCTSRGCGGNKCTYFNEKSCNAAKSADALALIQQLESKLNQSVEDMRMLGRMGQNICPVCAHHNHGEGSKEHCITCIINRDTDNFEWRGAKE